MDNFLQIKMKSTFFNKIEKYIENDVRMSWRRNINRWWADASAAA